MQRIIVLNPKGGSGKTTIASNLAACYAAHGERPTLMDLDPQGSSMRWLRKRPDEAPPIHGIAGFERSSAVTRSWQMRMPADCRTVIIDTPAAIDPHALPDLTRGVDAVLVPVMPSEIDIHATAKCIADLLLVAKIRRSEKAHRHHRQPRSQQHSRVAVADAVPGKPRHPVDRDAARHAELRALGGDRVGVCEMPRWQVQQDLPQWQQMLSWLAGPRAPHAGYGSARRTVRLRSSGRARSRSASQVAPLAGLSARRTAS